MPKEDNLENHEEEVAGDRVKENGRVAETTSHHRSKRYLQNIHRLHRIVFRHQHMSVINAA